MEWHLLPRPLPPRRRPSATSTQLQWRAQRGDAACQGQGGAFRRQHSPGRALNPRPCSGTTFAPRTRTGRMCSNACLRRTPNWSFRTGPRTLRSQLPVAAARPSRKSWFEPSPSDENVALVLPGPSVARGSGVLVRLAGGHVGRSSRRFGSAAAPTLGCSSLSRPGLAHRLAITIDSMQVLPQGEFERVFAWLGGLDYPWSSASSALRGIPKLESLAPIASFLGRNVATG